MKKGIIFLNVSFLDCFAEVSQPFQGSKVPYDFPYCLPFARPLSVFSFPGGNPRGSGNAVFGRHHSFVRRSVRRRFLFSGFLRRKSCGSHFDGLALRSRAGLYYLGYRSILAPDCLSYRGSL